MPLLGQFYEWTNTVFERLSSGEKFYKKNDAMQLSDAGYEALAPLGSMLACALGMSEIEFAKIKDKGREYEAQLLKSMFPKEGAEDSDFLKKAKDIFNNYSLDTSYSLAKKKINQGLVNELYVECLEIMKKRIENELQNDSTVNTEEYKKHQMFYLKKMNFNFKRASKSNGFIFLRVPIIHDIGYCTDEISRNDLLQIAQEHIAKTEFGFDNSSLGKYSQAMTSLKGRKAFIKRLNNSQIKTTELDEPLTSQNRVQDCNER